MTAFIKTAVFASQATTTLTAAIPPLPCVIYYGGAVTDSQSGNMTCNDLYATHIVSKAISPPTGYFGTGVPNATNLAITGSDTVGNIVFKTGSSVTLNGNIITIVFTKPFPVAPTVLLSGGNTSTYGTIIYSFFVLSTSTTSFTIQNVTGSSGGLAASTTYSVNWLAIC
jgi:hypothetical protein